MQVIYKLILKWVVLPLTKDLVVWLWKYAKIGFQSAVEYFRERKRKKQLKKKNNAKVKAYENAKSKDEHLDSYSDLP